jgi:hypothetical protein
VTPAVVILVPVLHRPWRVEPLVESIERATPEPHHVLFICTEDDAAEVAAIEAIGADHLVLPGPRLHGDYARKINAGYRASADPWLFLAADDLNFHRDWYSRALEYAVEGVDVVGTNDICNARVMTGEHSTHTLVRRSYIDRFSGVIDEPRVILHEGYAHQYSDDEFVQTARWRGRYAHAFDSIVEHMHPNVGRAEDDDTYALGRSRTRDSQRLFHERRRLWLT